MPSAAAEKIASASRDAHESEVMRAHLRSTPLEPANWFLRAIAAAANKRRAGANAAGALPPASVFLKLESEQRTGSFKARGALWKVSRLMRAAPEGAATSLTTASTGNHALATIFAVGAAAGGGAEAAAAAAGAAAAVSAVEASVAGAGAAVASSATAADPPELVVYVSAAADATKVARLRAAAAASAARVCVVVAAGAADCAGAEAEARRAAEQRPGCHYVSPYNDEDVVAGQGTLALELVRQLLGDGSRAEAEAAPAACGGARFAVFVPVGGGGLVAGVAAVLKCAFKGDRVRVYGCQPAANDIMARSCEAGAIVDDPAAAAAETLSDATAGGVEPGALTFPLCAELVDAWVRLSEREIADAVVSVLACGGKLLEGAAGCAAAALLKVAAERPAELAGRACVVVCCGGNAGVAALRRVLEVGRAWDLAV